MHGFNDLDEPGVLAVPSMGDLRSFLIDDPEVLADLATRCSAWDFYNELQDKKNVDWGDIQKRSGCQDWFIEHMKKCVKESSTDKNS